MATNTDKALYQAPRGLADITDVADKAPIEVEIEIGEPVEIEIEIEDDFNANLVELMDEGELASLAGDLDGDVDTDRQSRKDWEETYREGITLLGLKYEERTEPWNGACGVFHPMITEAVVRFQSETITETFPAQGPVRTKIIGKETVAKKESAQRVQDDMNYQLTDIMQEFRPEHEKMLFSLPATGSAFKKVYYDPALGRQTSMFVPAEDVLLPYGTADMVGCYRLTHVMRKTKNEITRLMQAGFYVDIELGEPTKFKSDIQERKDKETGFSAQYDDRYELYEIHVDLDLPGFEDTDEDGEKTGIALPYVVTMIRGTQDILSIRRNWREDDPLKLKRQHFVHYQYVPGFGSYGFGLFHLIGGFAKSSTSLIRQLVDAGTLSNLPGGLKARGMRIKGDDTPIAPGEWRDVDVAAGNIRDAILPLPYKEPSATLFNLLNTIVEEGRRFAATADLQVSDMSAQAPVGTTLALLERQLKVLSAVQARVHYAFKQELKLLAGIMRDYTDPDYTYQPEEGSPKARHADYESTDIIPVSDPNAATLSQRVVQYQAVIQMAQGAPDIYDLPYLHRQMLEVLGVKNADKLVPLEDDMKPMDPVSENMNVIKSEPIKAFQYQDHEAHIRVHTAAMQDPIVMELIGQNPKANQIMAAMQAHIAEHVGFGYRQKIEQQLGMTLPPIGEPLPPEAEYALSQLMAQAGQQLLQQHQAEAAQQQAQQAAQDPVLQLQQQDMQIKQEEVQRKAAKDQSEAEIQMAKLQQQKEESDRRFNLEMAKVRAEIERTDKQHREQQGMAMIQQGMQMKQAERQSAAPVPKEKKAK